MGRWSRLVAQSFVEWLPVSPGMHWLDVGCGSGALSEAILTNQQPLTLAAIDQSQGFVDTAQQRLGPNAQCKVGDALDLPIPADSMDTVVSGLVLNFIPDPEKALQEMARVTRPGGTVAVYVWDYPGKMDFLKLFWDAVVAQDATAASLHEGERFPASNPDGLRALFHSAGLGEAVVEPIEIETHFENFDDYWRPFLGGQGPAPTYVCAMEESQRNRLRDNLQQQLPIQADGRIPLVARAWAVRWVKEE